MRCRGSAGGVSSRAARLGLQGCEPGAASRAQAGLRPGLQQLSSVLALQCLRNVQKTVLVKPSQLCKRCYVVGLLSQSSATVAAALFPQYTQAALQVGPAEQTEYQKCALLLEAHSMLRFPLFPEGSRQSFGRKVSISKKNHQADPCRSATMRVHQTATARCQSIAKYMHLPSSKTAALQRGSTLRT